MSVQGFEDVLLVRLCGQDLTELVCGTLVELELLGQRLNPGILLLTGTKSAFQHLLHLDHREARWVPGFIQDFPHNLQIRPRIWASIERLLQLASDALIQTEVISDVLHLGLDLHQTPGVLRDDVLGLCGFVCWSTSAAQVDQERHHCH